MALYGFKLHKVIAGNGAESKINKNLFKLIPNFNSISTIFSFRLYLLKTELALKYNIVKQAHKSIIQIER